MEILDRFFFMQRLNFLKIFPERMPDAFDFAVNKHISKKTFAKNRHSIVQLETKLGVK